MNPEPFLQLDRVIHEKGRLAIMSMLRRYAGAVVHGDARRVEHDGWKLDDAHPHTSGGGICFNHEIFSNNRPLTTCSLTPGGQKAFTNYINLLEQIIQQNKPK